MSRINLSALVTVVCVGTSSLCALGAPEAVMVNEVQTLPTAGGNRNYVSNRSPLLPSPLIKLPAGAIRPQGWLRGQLVREADGFTGHLTEISPWCKTDDNAWLSPNGKGKNGWEELPYWLKGFVDLGYVLDDKRIIGESKLWIDGVLASQQPDGYFGPKSNQDATDFWPNMIMLNALQSYYEATGDARVLRLMTGYFRYQNSLPKDELLRSKQQRGWWQMIRGGDNLASVYWLYNRTGEAWLLELAQKLHEQTADWTGGIPTWHGVNICQGFREPAEFYQQSHDPKHLQATEHDYATVMGMYGQVPGGMFGADENCRAGYTGPRQAAETCSMVEFMLSDEMLLGITGDPKYADRCEEVALNSLPASMTPDLKGLHYLTAPNMVQLDRNDKSPMLQDGGCMLAYNPHSYRCCQHNVSHGWPYYSEHLWMATQGDGLAAVLYAPCDVTAKVGDGVSVRISEATDYPFRETVDLKVTPEKPVRFPLYLRVPGWCAGATVKMNGAAAGATGGPHPYLRIDREWQAGDTVRLTLPMRIKVRVWEKNHNSVSIDRGPLTYSLKIKERWERYDGTEEWPGYEVFPESPWNYGLAIDPQNPAAGIQFVDKGQAIPDQPFTPDAAPVELRVPARRIPEWQMQNGLVGLLQESPAYADAPVETVTLVPMSCARLRISAFPTVSDAPSAHHWVTPPPPPTASHVHDSLYALNDGILPQNSNDHAVPRFTWWDHRGTREWVQYDFPAARKLSWTEVYWFDDTGVGQCRVPASWHLLYLDGDQWRPVTATSAYGVKPDCFNRVTFTAVASTGWRLEVQLRNGFSGGILEWRVGE